MIENDEALTQDEPRAPPPKYFLLALVVGLTVWGAYLAIGAAVSGRQGWSLGRGAVVVVSFVIFLAWFGGLQWLYMRRNRKR